MLWEYLTIDGDEDWSVYDIRCRLPELGKEGWELVSCAWLIERGETVLSGAVFKRPEPPKQGVSE